MELRHGPNSYGRQRPHRLPGHLPRAVLSTTCRWPAASCLTAARTRQALPLVLEEPMKKPATREGKREGTGAQVETLVRVKGGGRPRLCPVS